MMTEPLPKPSLPYQFKWKAMASGDESWLYQIKCKICKWEKLSDFYNVQEWAIVHSSFGCQRGRP